MHFYEVSISPSLLNLIKYCWYRVLYVYNHALRDLVCAAYRFVWSTWGYYLMARISPILFLERIRV